MKSIGKDTTNISDAGRYETSVKISQKLLTKDGKSEAPNYTAEKGITSGYVLGGDGLISDGFAKTIFGAEEIIK